MSAQTATNPAKQMFQQRTAQLMREAKPSRLSFDDYVDSVKQTVKGKRWHVDSSSKPSSVREVRLHEDGHYSCSCPAGSRKTCVHRKAVIEATAPIELTIAPMPEPCRCVGCTGNNRYGCIRRANANDWQAVAA